jgi:cyanophycin synthetase
MKKRDIEILGITHLRGPNMWTYRPVLEALIDIGELEDHPSNTLPGFYERLAAWMPTLIEHRCSYEERGGFLRRLREGTWPGHILEHVALELLTLAGMPGGFGRARETSRRGVYKVVVRAFQEEVTRQALYGARDLVMAAIEDRPYDVADLVTRLRELADDLCLGPSTGAIVSAADDRSIPAIRLNEGNLVQLGYGARQRRIWTAETDRTSAIAEGISRDKDLTKQLLSACGVPVPEGRIVDSPEDAWAAAEEIGLPVVVKPWDANHGRGVCLDLSSRAEIEAAYAIALEQGSGVMVERFISGSEHRLLVVGGRMVAAARGDAASVIGDGRSTVRELIDTQLNTNLLRGVEEDFPLNPVRLDSAVRLELSRQDLSPDSVPAQGRQVLIQRNGNVSRDITEQVHPSVAATVALAARVVGLDVAGIDLVAEDISRPLGEQGGAIVEVNAGPGLLMHLRTAEGSPRPVGRAIADHLFPPDDDGRIPIVGVSGTRGRTAVSRLVAHLLHIGGMRVGLACGAGLYLDRRRVATGDCATFDPAQRLLLNRMVKAAVIESSPLTMASEGLPYDRCLVGVVTALDPTATLAERYIETSEQMYRVLRTQVDVVLPNGVAVLNAADPQVAEMAPLCDGEVIFFAADPAAPAIVTHCEDGGRAVFVRDERVVLATGTQEFVLAETAHVALAGEGCAGLDIETFLAALGAAWALGISAESIRAGIETFDTTEPSEGDAR